MSLLVKMDKDFSESGFFLKYLEIYFSQVVIALKQNKEYVFNTYMVLFLDLIFLFSLLVFYFVFGTLMFEVIGWSNYDFIVYFFVILIAGKLQSFCYLWSFSFVLTTGLLNNYLVLPINTFFSSILSVVNGAAVVSLFPVLFIFIFILFFSSYSLYLMFLSFLILILGVILQMLFSTFLESLAFFIKKNDFLVHLFNFEINYLNEKYTPVVFDHSFLKDLFYVLPSAVYGFFVIEALNGSFDLFIEYLPLILFFCLCLFVGMCVCWKYGLERYEAFG